jgi:cytochrome P450
MGDLAELKDARAGACPMAGDHRTLKGGESRLDPDIRHNPYPFYAALREQAPVYYDPGLDVWLVTKYDDVMAVLRDNENYSLERGYQERYANGHVDRLAEIVDRDGGGFVRDIVACDPPQHTRLRGLLGKAFTAHRVKELEPRIRQIVIDLIEPLAERGQGDGMRDIAAPLTARLICEQLGFDFDEVGTQKIADWTTAILAQIGRMQTEEEVEQNARLICDLQNYIIPRIREREAAPSEDMTSDLVHAEIEDEAHPKLSFPELVASIRALLIAGNDTTAAAITNLMLMLATRPGFAEQLYDCRDDDRRLGRLVEEVLRLQPPSHGLFRTTTRAVELGGVAIPADAQVCILFASGNADPAEFPCPEAIDLDRPNIGQNLTFGAGIHRCIGIALARMEIKVAAQEIIRRLDDIRLAIPVEELRYLPTLATQTLEALPLTFKRRGEGEAAPAPA